MAEFMDKAATAMAKFYDAIENLEADLVQRGEATEGEDEQEYTLNIADAAVVAPFFVTDKDGNWVSKGTIVQSSCRDYATHGVLLKGVEVVS